MTSLEDKHFTLDFIKKYQSLPALWDVNNKDYSSRLRKISQYEELVSKYREKYPNAQKRDVTKKINSLRTNFRKELKRISAGECDKPTSWYYNALKFLIPKSIPQRKAICKSQKMFNSNNYQRQNFSELISHEVVTSSRRQTVLNTCSKAQSDSSQSTYFANLASLWAADLQKMDPLQQILTRKAVDNIIIEGLMGTLTRDSVQIRSDLSKNSKQVQRSSRNRDTTTNVVIKVEPEDFIEDSNDALECLECNAAFNNTRELERHWKDHINTEQADVDVT